MDGECGRAASWILGALLVVDGLPGVAEAGPGDSVADSARAFSWDTVNFLATIAYAMTGLEMVGFMGGEIRHPRRDISARHGLRRCSRQFFMQVRRWRCWWFCVRRISARSMDSPKWERPAGRVLGINWLPPAIAVLVLATALGQFGGLGSSVSRMPFAAGVDHLLPAAFAKIHPRWATPYVSILVFGGLASVLMIVSQFGDTLRGAYQTLVSLMVIGGFVPYVYMFGSAWKVGHRVSAVSGWAVTALAILCSLVPTGEIHNVWLFELKLAAGTFAVIASAWLVYRRSSGP